MAFLKSLRLGVLSEADVSIMNYPSKGWRCVSWHWPVPAGASRCHLCLLRYVSNCKNCVPTSITVFLAVGRTVLACISLLNFSL